MLQQQTDILQYLSSRPPQAMAQLKGNGDNPALEGCLGFYQTTCGVYVVAVVSGLPEHDGCGHGNFFALHIHQGGQCVGNIEDPFAQAGTHYNPEGCAHPQHAGDLPPLLSNHGCAFSTIFTDRFLLNDIIGKTVIIHSGVDDFTSQPAGNAGRKIACGVIQRIRRA